eukprot:gb/GECH01004994.1/.p1 GENE.gb/GECH01004994.1/~~gb/GECH01004994.1/.p1  ORF type:complete len:237 (+),score=40.48 gb/GECH01004994.1/:1-711(+)
MPQGRVRYDRHLKQKKDTKNYNQRRNVFNSRPNFFLGLRICNQQVIRNISKVQTDILSKTNNKNVNFMRKTLVSPIKAHITLGVLRLESQRSISHALQTLKLCEHIVPQTLTIDQNENEYQPYVSLRGISHFRQRVLYGAVHNDNNLFKLTQFADQVSQTFQKTDIPLKINQPFTPHVTIAKIRDRESQFPREVCNDISSQDLGHATFEYLDLTQMQGLDDDGYYPVIGSIPLIKN